MNRRTFIRQGAQYGTGGFLLPGLLRSGFLSRPSKRPPLTDRKFRSPAVEDTILKVKTRLRDPELGWLFENCFPNTLDSTVRFTPGAKPDTFVITGDIPAMWLRDSSAQVWPYLPLAARDPALKELLAGVINRQVSCILLDPYANAFNYGPTQSPWDHDLTEMKPGVHERKWELDSLCYPIRLSYGYWKQTGDIRPFDTNWKQAMELAVQTFRTQQRISGRGPYHFGRVTSWSTDTVPGNGYGNPERPVGLIVSIFRPSDDATIFPFLIPSNYFARISLKQLAEISRTLYGDQLLANLCDSLAAELTSALDRFACGDHGPWGNILAYEADGYGNQLFQDDANIPSLLSLPYLGALNPEDPLYLRTRKFLLSDTNPYFFKGSMAEGIGSPHTLLNRVWPISIMIQALTSRDESEIRSCLGYLRQSAAATGFMHESFDPSDPLVFTRPWFAWANTLFGELILHLLDHYPQILS